jgi:hypothetical protein
MTVNIQNVIVVCILTDISMASESYVLVICILTVISMASENYVLLLVY